MTNPAKTGLLKGESASILQVMQTVFDPSIESLQNTHIISRNATKCSLVTTQTRPDFILLCSKAFNQVYFDKLKTYSVPIFIVQTEKDVSEEIQNLTINTYLFHLTNENAALIRLELEDAFLNLQTTRSRLLDIAPEDPIWNAALIPLKSMLDKRSDEEYEALYDALKALRQNFHTNPQNAMQTFSHTCSRILRDAPASDRRAIGIFAGYITGGMLIGSLITYVGLTCFFGPSVAHLATLVLAGALNVIIPAAIGVTSGIAAGITLGVIHNARRSKQIQENVSSEKPESIQAIERFKKHINTSSTHNDSKVVTRI